MEKTRLKKVDFEDYIVKQTIGVSSFGRVKLILHKKENKYYALKIFKKAEVLKLKQVDHVLSEVGILNMIEHPFLINFLGISQNNRFMYIVMEYVQGGELFDRIQKTHKINNVGAMFYAGQVILMLEYLHSKNIVHRDIKPENLLIDARGYLKLIDFGISKVVEGRTYTLCGTFEYLAPEILLQKGHGPAADWWCLGVLIYEMLVGIDPFSDKEPMTVYKNILSCNLKFPKSFEKNAKSLVKHLIMCNLSKRFGNLKGGVEDIKEHRWFDDFSWKNLLKKEIRPPFLPNVKSDGDTSNYFKYPEEQELPNPLNPIQDPFLDW